jgi:hypothetical protein
MAMLLMVMAAPAMAKAPSKACPTGSHMSGPQHDCVPNGPPKRV